MAREKKRERFATLLYHIDTSLLRQTYFCLKRDAAPHPAVPPACAGRTFWPASAGVDGIIWNTYAEGREARLRDLESRIIEQLTPYLVGWRSYFGFCKAPRVLTNLEAWIRRRLCSYLWRQWATGVTASKNCVVVAYQSSERRPQPARRRASGACQDTRRSKRPCVTTTSIRSVSPDSMFWLRLNPIEPPWYATRMPVGVGGVAP